MKARRPRRSNHLSSRLRLVAATFRIVLFSAWLGNPLNIFVPALTIVFSVDQDLVVSLCRRVEPTHRIQLRCSGSFYSLWGYRPRYRLILLNQLARTVKDAFHLIHNVGPPGCQYRKPGAIGYWLPLRRAGQSVDISRRRLPLFLGFCLLRTAGHHAKSGVFILHPFRQWPANSPKYQTTSPEG